MRRCGEKNPNMAFNLGLFLHMQLMKVTKSFNLVKRTLCTFRKGLGVLTATKQRTVEGKKTAQITCQLTSCPRGAGRYLHGLCLFILCFPLLTLLFLKPISQLRSLQLLSLQVFKCSCQILFFFFQFNTAKFKTTSLCSEQNTLHQHYKQDILGWFLWALSIDLFL